MDKQTKNKVISSAIEDFSTIDPMGALVISAAGIAGLCGYQGPISTIMNGILGKTHIASGGFNPLPTLSDPFWLNNPISGNIAKAIGEGLGWKPGQGGLLNPKTPEPTDEVKAQVMNSVGMAAANMVEAAIMYKLVSNPETMRTLMDMSKEAVKGAVGLAKGVGALGAL